MFRNIDLKALQYREVDGKNKMPGKYEFDD